MLLIWFVTRSSRWLSLTKWPWQLTTTATDNHFKKQQHKYTRRRPDLTWWVKNQSQSGSSPTLVHVAIKVCYETKKKCRNIIKLSLQIISPTCDHRWPWVGHHRSCGYFLLSLSLSWLNLLAAGNCIYLYFSHPVPGSSVIGNWATYRTTIKLTQLCNFAIWCPLLSKAIE